MKRFLALIFGLAIAVAVLYLLVSREPSEPPSAEIDDASRAKLERVLEQAETQGED